MKRNSMILLLVIATLIFSIAMPLTLLLTRDSENTGQIGDTIGGLTTPLINFLAAILVYFSFKEQIKANNLLHGEQINQRFGEFKSTSDEYILEVENNWRKILDYRNCNNPQELFLNYMNSRIGYYKNFSSHELDSLWGYEWFELNELIDASINGLYFFNSINPDHLLFHNKKAMIEKAKELNEILGNIHVLLYLVKSQDVIWKHVKRDMKYYCRNNNDLNIVRKLTPLMKLNNLKIRFDIYDDEISNFKKLYTKFYRKYHPTNWWERKWAWWVKFTYYDYAGDWKDGLLQNFISLYVPKIDYKL